MEYLEYVRKEEANRKRRAAYLRAYEPEFRRLGGPDLEAAKASCSDCKGAGHIYDRKLALYVRCHCLEALLAVEARAQKHAWHAVDHPGGIKEEESTGGGNCPREAPAIMVPETLPQPLQSPADMSPYGAAVFTYHKSGSKKLVLHWR